MVERNVDNLCKLNLEILIKTSRLNTNYFLPENENHQSQSMF